MSKKERAKLERQENQEEGIGSLLKKGREAKGLSLTDMGKQLNLANKTVDALEREDFGALPATVFVQGYLRSYAKIIDIDAQMLIDIYQAQMPKQKYDSLLQPTVKQEVHSGHGPVKIVSWVIALGLIALAAVWWSSQDEQVSMIDQPVEEPVVEAPLFRLPEITAPESEPVAEEPQQAGPVEVNQVAEESEPAVVEEAVSPAAPEPAIETTEQEAVVEEVVEQPTATDGKWDIVLAFSGPSWVNIRDADSKRQILGNMSAGTIRTLEGPAPYSVVIGDSAMVELRINGKAIDLRPYSNKRKVARFTLDPAELALQ